MIAGAGRHSAEYRRYEEVVLFVHHYGGNASSLDKHVALVNGLGYDCVTFNLSHQFSSLPDPDFLPTTLEAIKHPGGYVGMWTEEIDQQVDAIEEDVIVFSFSSLGMAVPATINHYQERIKGWICDGGPFFDFNLCFENYFKRYLKIDSPLKLKGYLAATFLSWHGWSLEKRVHNALLRVHRDFQVMSIRGADDPLVSMESIDKVFREHPHLKMTVLNLGKTGHLNGISMRPDIYEERVEKFLSSCIVDLA